MKNINFIKNNIILNKKYKLFFKIKKKYIKFYFYFIYFDKSNKYKLINYFFINKKITNLYYSYNLFKEFLYEFGILKYDYIKKK